MKPYVVQQGEYLAKLAFRMGFDAEKVWADPANRELCERRSDPNILCPGDVLFVPEGEPDSLPFSQGTTNRFRAAVPTVPVKLKLRHAGLPIANEPYRVEGAGRELEGVTDGDGVLAIEVALNVREVTVLLTRRKVTYRVRVGDLDPATEPSGIAMRLAHLGYLRDPLGEQDPATIEHAVASYQAARGLPATGSVDAETKAELEREHGR